MVDYKYDLCDPNDVCGNETGIIDMLAKAIDATIRDNDVCVIESTAAGLIKLDRIRPDIAPGFLGLEVKVVPQFWIGNEWEIQYRIVETEYGHERAIIGPGAEVMARSA